jgi:aspartyl-tRNA(Asn)/glutamyl-tRNA(Gln) amidotransferase subunit B
MKTKIPEMPMQKRQRFVDEYGFTVSDAKILTDDIHLANYVEKIMSELHTWLRSLPDAEIPVSPIGPVGPTGPVKTKLSRLVSTWLITKLFGLMEKHKINIRTCKVTPENFAEFITLIYQNHLSSSAALKVLEEMILIGGDPSQIMDEKRLGQMGDEEELAPIIERIIKNNPKQVEEYKAGKIQVFQFFIGLAMKETEGRADAKIVKRLLNKFLK